MKLTISKEQISNGLQAVQNIVSTRTTLPVLSNVLLQADGQWLDLTATDLDVTISCRVPAAVHQPGSITLPARKLFGIVRELPASDIEISLTEGRQCAISAGSSHYKMFGLGADEFPPLPKIEPLRQATLPQEKFKALLRRTSYAISTDETRFVLNGIFVALKEHTVTVVATDGRRLALAEEEIDVPAASYGESIIPNKAIAELNRLLQSKGEVEIKFTENQAAFYLTDERGAAIRLVSKLIEGNYPNYRQVIPAEVKERITLVREELLQALRRAELMTTDKANSVKLAFTRNNLAITANAPEIGEARESVAINYNGPDIAIAFNPIFMMDPLKVLENDEVYLELVDELSPGVIKIQGRFLYVLMPMRMS
jgi:DNA polymerase III subunit beta